MTDFTEYGLEDEFPGKLGKTIDDSKEALAEARSRGILPEDDALDARGKVPERR